MQYVLKKLIIPTHPIAIFANQDRCRYEDGKVQNLGQVPHGQRVVVLVSKLVIQPKTKIMRTHHKAIYIQYYILFHQM